METATYDFRSCPPNVERWRDVRMPVETLRFIIIRSHEKHPPRRRGLLLWVWLKDFVGVGQTSACNICRTMGWDPDQLASKKLE